MESCRSAVIKAQNGVPAVRATRDLWLSPGWIGPAPGVAKPHGRDQVQLGIFWTAIEGFDANANVFRACLGVLDKNVKVAVIVEDAGIEEFVLRPPAITVAVLLDQLMIGELPLRILVYHLHVAVCGSVVEVEVIFLYI